MKIFMGFLIIKVCFKSRATWKKKLKQKSEKMGNHAIHFE